MSLDPELRRKDALFLGLTTATQSPWPVGYVTREMLDELFSFFAFTSALFLQNIKHNKYVSAF